MANLNEIVSAAFDPKALDEALIEVIRDEIDYKAIAETIFKERFVSDSWVEILKNRIPHHIDYESIAESLLYFEQEEIQNIALDIANEILS